MIRAVLILACLWTGFSTCTASKSCYQCDPTSEGNCVFKNPTHINDCTQPSPIENEPLEDYPTEEYNCVSYYAKDKDEKQTGHYRQCIPKDKSCKTIQEQTKKAVISCKVCEQDNCNTDNFSTKDNKNANGEVGFSVIAVLVLLASGFILLII